MKNTLLFIAASMVFPMLAHGATWKESGYVEITKLYAYDLGIIFYTNYSDTAVSSCDNGSRFSIRETSENYPVKASMLMAAFMANKEILFRYDADQPRACEAIVGRFIVKR